MEITKRGPATGLVPIQCEVCETEFQPYRSWQTTCSRPCRDKAPKREKPWTTEREVTCRYCEKPFTVRAAANARFVACPPCRPAFEADHQQRKNAARRVGANPAMRERQLKQNLRRLYGMTPDGLRAMQEAQGNRCAICGDEPDPSGKQAASRLHVDHCHTTGRVRALLCLRCNNGIGLFMEDPRRLAAASEYLSKWQGESEK